MTDLALRDTGTGAPTLLFVHGYACGMEDWDAQIEALKDRHRCVSLNLPGHGGTPAPEDPSVAAMAKVVRRVIADCGDAVVPVGHSIGCKIIREACCPAPETVAGMIFINGAFYARDTQEMQEGARLFIEVSGFPAFIRDYFGAASGMEAPAGHLAHVIERAQRLDPGFGRDFYLSGVEFDRKRGEETLARIAAPVLALQSARIDATGRRVAMTEGVMTPFMERVQHLVPKSEIVTITGSSHFPMRDRAETVTTEILDFLQVLAAGDAGAEERRKRTL